MNRSHNRSKLILPAAVVILAAVVAVARIPRVGVPLPTTESDSPEACIARLLAAERQGKLADYLECFTAAKRATLEAAWQGRPPDRIAAELRERSAGLVGQAVTNVALAESGRASLVLERIEKDHTQRQFVDLARDSGRWQIAELSAGDWQAPAIPYGTPVFTPTSGEPR